MDPRRSGKPGKASKAPLAPGARRLGAASDSESLPSAPSPQCPDLSPPRGDSKRRKSSSPESRRVVVAEPRAAVLRQRGEERPRLTPANALVLRGRAEVEGRKAEPEARLPQESEPRRKHDKLKGEKAEAKKAQKAKRPKEEQAPRKKQKAEQKAKQTGGSKHAEQEAQDEKGDDGKKKKKKEKKEKHKEKQKDKKDEEPQKPAPEPEPSDSEVQPPSPPKPKSQNVKSKKDKEKKADKAEKNRNKSEKEKKKATSKHREPEKPEKVEEKKEKAEKAQKASKKEVPTTRRKEKKSKQEAERSKSEDPPVQTADAPEAAAPRGHAAKASGRHRERQMEAEPQSDSETRETRERRRRKERPRSESRSRRRRRQRIFPPDAWQVWPAGSYHPWSSQLAGAPFGVWPMQSVPGDMSQAWIRNMQQPQVEAESDSSEESEDLEGRELEAPKAQEQEEEQEQSEEEEEEEEPELDQPSILKSTVPVPSAPGILKTTVPQPGILKTTAPGILKTTPPAQIAVDDDDGSATTRTSEGEESETESQDEDAEIGEAPVARRPIIELGKAVEDMPKVKWYPPGPSRPRAALHHSMQRWCGPKVGWMALYQLDIDPAVQMKSSVQQIREGDGKGVVDPDASEIEATSEANPSEAPMREEGPAVPLLIPGWGSTRGWASPSEVAVEESLRWEKRKLSSTVLRSRRAGRSSAGGGGGANPQDPPEADPDAKPSTGTSTFLIFLGTAARSVRILVEWRPPPALVLPEDVIVDPTKYRGVERNLRQKRRPKAAAKPAAKKKAAVKSSPGTPPPKVQPDPNTEYQAKLRALMQQLQDGSATADAVSTFWNSLSPANRVLFSSEFPQFMHLVQPDRAVQAKAMPVQAHMLPAASVMHLPVPPPPKTRPPAGSIPAMAVPAMMAAAPVAWAKASQLAPEIIKQQEAAWANRLTFHDGILRADMSSLQLGDAGLARWCKWAPSLLKTLGSAGGAPLSNADLNFSGNALEDAGLRQLLDLLRSCDVHVRCLNLDANRLTEASLVALSDFIAELRLAVSAVHMKNNRVQGSYGIMHLARAIKSNDKYPMLSESDKKRYTPLMLHLAGNMIDRPMQVTQLVKEALDNKFPSLLEDRQYWESKHQCPPLQLPCFDKQETSPFQ